MHAALAEIIQCPKCGGAVVPRSESPSLICTNPACTYAEVGFPVVANAPVLIADAFGADSSDCPSEKLQDHLPDRNVLNRLRGIP